MKKTIITLAAALAIAALPATAGEWHSGTTNLCTDCHTMHFSMQHDWQGNTTVSQTAQPNGNWLSATGPNNYLLKAPANALCLQCHDGQTFAPDVYAANTNAASMLTYGRSAGAINDVNAGAPYDTFKGHTLGSTATPPGFNPTGVGLTATYYDPTGGLECISCHAQHGPTTAYRNLGSYALGASANNFRPTYKFSTTPFDFAGPCRNQTTGTAPCDVRINLATYSANQGATNFGPYYDASNISYSRNDTTLNGTTITTSNRLDSFCASCHANFHGGPADATVANAQTVAGLDGFIRHPSSGITIGASGAAGYGGHSALTRYTGATTQVKVFSSTAGFTDATPGCLTCHKAHGNQNPFGLVFLNANSTTSYGAGDQFESGGLAAGQTENISTYGQGFRNLCGQCHGQGN